MSQSAPIKSQEIIEDGLFDPSKASADKFLASLEDLIAGLKLVNKESVSYLKSNKDPKTAEELKKTITALDKAQKSRKAVNEAEKETIKVKKAISDAEIKEAAVRKAIDKQRVDALKATAILQNEQIGREAKLLASNTLLRIERAKLTGEESNYKEELLRINSALDANNAIIKRIPTRQNSKLST